AREFQHRRNIHGKIGRSIGEGYSFTQRRIGVDHGRGDVLVILLKAALKSFDGRVDFTWLQKNLSGAAPDHYQPVSSRFLFEVFDVGAQLFRTVHLVAAFSHMLAIELLHITATKPRRAPLA